jgi:hypothetical protein
MTTETVTETIDLSQENNLDSAIVSTCDNFGFAGYHLAATFTFKLKLTMIFQRIKNDAEEE